MERFLRISLWFSLVVLMCAAGIDLTLSQQAPTPAEGHYTVEVYTLSPDGAKECDSILAESAKLNQRVAALVQKERTEKHLTPDFQLDLQNKQLFRRVSAGK